MNLQVAVFGNGDGRLSFNRPALRSFTSQTMPANSLINKVNPLVLSSMSIQGLVEAHGSGRGRTYMPSAKVYRTTGQKAACIRQAGFDPIQQERMVLKYIDQYGSIKRAEVAELCHLTPPQAYHLLNKLKNQGKIQKEGERRHAVYTRKT